MKKQRNGLTAALIAAGVAVLVLAWYQWAGPTPEGVGAQAPRVADAGATDPSRVSPFGAMAGSSGSVAAGPTTSAGWWERVGTPASDEASSPLSTMTPPGFSADPRGRLTLNAQTHANIERLFLAGTPQEVQAQLQEVSRDLPDTAARELRDLVAKFQKYTTALSQSMPPGNEVNSEQEATQQLQQLHSLRASYLGEETAQALFGEEEAMSRHMIAMAQLEKDPTLTLQQKAERAQEALSKLTGSSLKR